MERYLNYLINFTGAGRYQLTKEYHPDLTAMLLANEGTPSNLPQLERLQGTDYIGVRGRQGGLNGS